MASSSGSTWNKEETLRLIDIWGDDRIQAQLEGAHRNRNVYMKIAREMSEAGYQRTLEQCRDKIKKLKGEYKKLKDKCGKTGEGRRNWDYFEAMDSILGHKPATHPQVVIDTMAEDTGPGPEEEDELSELTSLDAVNEVASVLNTASPPTSRAGTPAPSTSRAGTPAPSSRAGTPAPSTSRAGTPTSLEPASRKRKRSVKENIVGELLQKVIDAQNTSDLKMMELEEKRLKMEERQMEREAQLRREEREFQMQMVQLMMSQSCYSRPQTPLDRPPSASFSFGTSIPSYDYSNTHYPDDQ